MTKQTHIAGNILLTECILCEMPWPVLSKESAIMITAAFAGALLPDIDHGSSTITRASPGTQVISAGARLISGHRGFFHSAMFALFMSFILYYFMPLNESDRLAAAVGIFSGIVSHLILDMLNQQGIMLFFPFTKKRIHIMKIRVGAAGEKLVRTLIVFAIILYTIYLYTTLHI